MTAPLEREIKLRFDSPESARRAVLALGPALLRPRRLQADVVLDRGARELGTRGDVLRVRMDEGQHALTFKSPLTHPTMKLREELETSIGDASVVVTILQRLGFEVAFRYEKFREEYTLGEVIVAIDETPVGTFVELEGSDAGILAAAEALGRRPEDFVIESYRGLYVQSCAAQGVPATDMLFARSDE